MQSNTEISKNKAQLYQEKTTIKIINQQILNPIILPVYSYSLEIYPCEN